MTAELRAWVEIDSMQSQWAAYVAQTCQGDPPHAGMAQLYVEVAPASRVFALVNAAVKHARVRSALQVVERQYGTLELHGADPSVVRQAGSAVLELLGASATDRELPQVVSHEIVTRVDPNQAQLVNRMRVANLLLEDETMFLIEVAPATYVAAAANAAEKQAPVKLVYAAMLGATGRLIMAHRSPEVVNEAYLAALAAVGASSRVKHWHQARVFHARGAAAIASISTSWSVYQPRTATPSSVLGGRAGANPAAMTSQARTRSDCSEEATYTVVFRTSAADAPAAERATNRFSTAFPAWASMPPGTTTPASSIGHAPAANTIRPASVTTA